MMRVMERWRMICKLSEVSEEELEAEGQSLVARRALSAQAKVDDMEQ